LSNPGRPKHYFRKLTTMQEFLLLFRQPDADYRATPEKMKEIGKKWHGWVDSIVKQDKFVSHGIRLSMDGKVLRAGGVVTDGPFVEIKEKLLSYVIVRAENIDDAVTLSHGCPAIDAGGSVEIRPVYSQTQ
jgi:hypothetical protein